MTVAELIEALCALPGDTPVTTRDDDGDLVPVEEIEVVAAVKAGRYDDVYHAVWGERAGELNVAVLR